MVNVLKWLGVLLLGIVLGYVLRDTGLSRVIDERRAEAVGTLASSYIASQTELDDRTDVKTVAGLQHIEVGAR